MDFDKFNGSPYFQKRVLEGAMDLNNLYKRKLPDHIFEKSYVNEAKFKQDFIDYLRYIRKFRKVFEIENEEKEPGFPDIMGIFDLVAAPAEFYEIKITDKNGDFKFQKTQPLFYKKHFDLPIEVILWDNISSAAWSIPVEGIVRSKKLRFNIAEFEIFEGIKLTWT